MKDCPRKFYEHHLRPDNLAIDLTPSDTHRAFIGSAVQHIMETVINDRWYKKESIETIMDMVDSDLKAMKPLIVDTSTLEKPIDGWDRKEIEGSKILKSIQMCACDTSKSYNIWVAQNTVIKKIRDMYKSPLKYLLSRDDVDLMRSEVPFKVTSQYFAHQGELDFLIHRPDGLIIMDGKKSASSFLDEDQLYHYKLMAELKTGLPVIDLGFLVYDEGVLAKVDNPKDSSQDLLSRMYEKWLQFQKWKDPEDFPYNRGYSQCMFCIVNDNCLGNNTFKGEITEI